MSLFASSFETGLTAGPSQPFNTSSKSKSHKRKRPSTGGEANKDEQLRATQKNLERLMKAVEKGGLEKDSKMNPHGNKSGNVEGERRKAAKDVKVDRHADGFADFGGPSTSSSGKAKKQKQEKKVGQPQKPPHEDKGAKKKDNASKGNRKAVEIPIPLSPSKEDDTAGLTSLQKGMKTKLEGARFRWINEQLYSTPSTEAVAMMKKDPKIFADYHMTHRVLTSAWPSPPLPYIVDLLDPSPRGYVIVDLGCGDAGLARTLVPKGKVVLSYDLVGDDGVSGAEDTQGLSEGWVVRADFLTSVPLPGRPGGTAAGEESEGKKRKKKSAEAGSEVVDAVVCCLSLMGTNWVGGIYEACRILKQGGVFHVAEVTSRFTSTEAFIDKVTSFGFQLDNQESPSTHFTLFSFTKTAPFPVGVVRGQSGWDERIKEGEGILQACVYKKR